MSVRIFWKFLESDASPGKSLDVLTSEQHLATGVKGVCIFILSDTKCPKDS